MGITVIKLGGSLMRSAELSGWLNSIESVSTSSNIIIVPGGGEFADSVRSLQNEHEIDDHTAHRMALLAMCQYGYLLAGMNPKLHIVKDIELLSSFAGKNIPLIWLPMSLIEDDSEIAASWDFTSDSIALWLATRLLAEKLVLVKLEGSNNVTQDSIKKHVKNGYLDKGFQELSNTYSGDILFMGKSQYREFCRSNLK